MNPLHTFDDDTDSAPRRFRMVNEQLSTRGIHDSRVIAAFLEVPRALFVPRDLVAHAYDDAPLAIEEGQTISQPYVVAWMAEALELDATSRVLEIGTGSGYGTAILAELASHVVSVERLAGLAMRARERVTALQHDNVTFVVGDGSLGFPEGAPYDAIVVTAAAPAVPEALLSQLREGGRLVIPVGPLAEQRLLRVRRRGSHFASEDLGPVVFVPLIGARGFREGELPWR